MCDRGGAIGPPNHSENDDRGGECDLHRPANHFDLRNLNEQMVVMACSRFRKTVF